MGLGFAPFFVPRGGDAESLFEWSRRASRIVNANGVEIFSQNNVEAPRQWSDLAVDISASRYFRRTSVAGQNGEDSIRQMVHRVAHTLRDEGFRRGYFLDAASANAFEQDLKFILLSQRAAFNSPVWFNLGLFHEYGITTNGGNFRYFPEHNAVLEVNNNYAWPQVSACFILSAKDDLMEIFNLLKTEARLFKYGSGTGSNFSNLRGSSELLRGGGRSSGLISFLEVYDRAAGATKSGGTTRRAAKMVCVDADHPDILEFIQWKKTEEIKAQVLIRAGYSSDMDGPAYRTVAGQNSNNSVRLSDEFFMALQGQKTWELLARTDGRVTKVVPAQTLWDELVEAAWFCADPGVQFSSTIEMMNPCKASGTIRASNPCSEYMFLDDSACNLASLNLVAFFDKANTFQSAEFEHVARLIFVAQDILVGMASYPTPRVAQNSFDFRPIGIGYANLGALFMRSGLAYGSAESVAWTEGLTGLLHAVAAQTSVELAEHLGAFPQFENNRPCFFEVMQQHTEAYQKLPSAQRTAHWVERAQQIWFDAMTSADHHGFRNAQWTVLAPTGTIGLLMDCDTTGIEPDFALSKVKKLTGGGSLTIVNQSVEPGLRSLGYSTDKIAIAVKHLEVNGTLQGAIDPGHLAVFDCAANDSVGRSLQVDAHLNVVAAAQKFLSGAISKTVNLPSSATVEDVGKLYMQAHKMGIKAISIYRSGSKWSEPLSSSGAVAPRCSECGFSTVTTGGCYRCLNCGHAESC
jgi:ribonucleoside-diphosphate reductase alpha chain